MKNTHTLISDIEMNNELLLGLKRRNVNQKFLYADDNAIRYYDEQKNGDPDYEKSVNYNKLSDFIAKNIDTNNFTAIVSLGCGDTTKEITVCENLGSNMELFAVDSSRKMIDLASKQLEQYDGKYNLMLADFTSPEFHDEITSLTSGHKHRIFAFLGSTLGNVSQTEMLDTLYNTMQSDDMIWIGVMTRPSLSREDNFKAFESSQKFVEREEMADFCFDPLKYRSR